MKRYIVLVIAVLLLVGCGSKNSNSPGSTVYAVGGTVSGLTGAGLVLQDSGADDLSVAENVNSFVFATALANGASYNATVKTQPAGQTCTVANGAGTVSGANVTNVAVTCITAGLTVTSTSPANLATGVTLTATINATFSKALDASTITNATFLVSKGANTISGTVAASGFTATFTPVTVLAASTVYTATLTTGVKDSTGSALATAYTWTFTTKPVVIAVQMSSYANAALDTDGNVWTWGDDSNLGRTPAANKNTVPGKVGISNVIAIAMAGDATAHVAAAKSDGTVWTWGWYGCLGTGSTSNSSSTPVQATMTLPAGVKVTALAAGRDHVLALRSDGIVMSWGGNYD
jgi:hypothetical protein